jgi:phosphohistidine phosphatase
MDVYLVRHAIAEQRDAGRWPDDSRRPLTPEGEERFRATARGLRRIVPRVAVLLASPYARAWRTAELLTEEAGWPLPERCAALEAERSAAEAAEALRDRRVQASVALVGHEPQLSSLAALLLAGRGEALRLELKKGGLVRLALDAVPAPGTAVLRWSVAPRILRLLDASR